MPPRQPQQHPMSGPRRGTTAPSQTPTAPSNNAPTPPPAPAAPSTPPAPTQGPMLPPQQNGPIFPDSQGGPGGAQPISYGSGSYNPTTAPYGFDMSMPGVEEQMWNNNQGMWFDTPGIDWVDTQLQQFNDPWAYEQWVAQNASSMGGPSNTGQYWAGVQGSMNEPTGAESAVMGGYQGPNNAQTAFDMTMGRIPQSFQPQFDAYYDRMKDKVMSDVNSQSAARGVYGSNTALNNSIGAGLDIEAQRAKAATDFMLKDSANQRAWLDSLSGQGRAADLSGLGAYEANLAGSRYGLDKTKTLGDLAFRADAAELDRDRFESDIRRDADDARASRIGAGVSTALSSDAARQGRLRDAFNFAGQAQDAFEGRVGGLYNEVETFTNDVVDFLGQNYDALLGGDKQISDTELETMIAQAADERGWDQQTQERIFRDVSKAIELYNESKAAKVAGGGG